MIIFTKNTRKTEKNQTEFEIRTLGATFWISEKEAQGYVDTEQAFFKANKPVYQKDLNALKK